MWRDIKLLNNLHISSVDLRAHCPLCCFIGFYWLSSRQCRSRSDLYFSHMYESQFDVQRIIWSYTVRIWYQFHLCIMLMRLWRLQQYYYISQYEMRILYCICLGIDSSKSVVKHFKTVRGDAHCRAEELLDYHPLSPSPLRFESRLGQKTFMWGGLPV